jgi:predicted RNA-binding protein Jag
MRKPKSKKHCENISKGRKGYKPRQESINKWKESMVKTGYAHLKTKEHRKKLSCIMSGKKKSEAHCRKMSEIMKGKSYNNYKRGYYNSEKSGKIFYRSSLELKAYIILDKDINISSFKPEPFSVDYVFEGYDRKYRPDLLITKTNGSKVLAEVKPHQEVKWLVNKAKFEGARKVCKDSGMNFKIMTDKYLDSIIGKQGELLETLSSILNKDNQQPSTSNESRSIVDVKVQRLIGENDSLNKPDKSALHPTGHVG